MSQFDRFELERYKAHITLSDIGGAGQQKLRQARVLVIGAGGLGSPCIIYLAAAGVGTIGIVDSDRVELSNLQRQIVHNTSDVKQFKAFSAAAKVNLLNPNVKVIPYNTRFDYHNADDLVSQYDIIADGSDNFTTRCLVAATAAQHMKPLVSAAVGQFDGLISTFKPYEYDNDGNLLPGYGDVFPSLTVEGDDEMPCSRLGIISPLTGIMGTMQAMEIIKEITGVGDSLAGRLLIYDAKRCRLENIDLTSLRRDDKSAAAIAN